MGGTSESRLGDRRLDHALPGRRVPRDVTDAGSAAKPYRVLGLIALGGFVLRVVTTNAYYRELTLGWTDNFFYHQTAQFLVDGKGFADPFHWEQTGELIASADHPPLYSMYLALFSLLGLDSPMHHRVASCLLGATTVFVIGVVAARLAGARAGIISAVVAALYPPLWIVDGTLVAESPYALWMALLVLVSLRLNERPSLGRAAVVGLVLGLAALTRSEATGLFVLLVAPLMLVTRVGWGRRFALAGMVGLVAVASIAPWALRNEARFEEHVPLAYGAGYVMKIGNCDPTYHGEKLGYWDITCAYAKPLLPDKSVSEVDARAQATDYIADHKERLPAVVAARVGRLWHVYRVEQGITYDQFFERRGHLASQLAVPALYAVVLLGAAGAWAQRRRPAVLVTTGALVVSATVSAALAFAITRYRIAGDVALVILAGIGLDAMLRAWSRRRGAPT